jgi:hypothetical protein
MNLTGEKLSNTAGKSPAVADVAHETSTALNAGAGESVWKI